MTTSEIGAGNHRADEEPSFGELVAAASRDLSLLIHSEIELAKSELRVDVKAGAAGFGALIVAGVFGFFMLAMLLVAFAEGISAAGLPIWAGFLIVAGVMLLFAIIVGLIGLLAMRRIKAPRRTIETTKDTMAMVKNRKLSPSHSYTVNGRRAETVEQHRV